MKKIFRNMFVLMLAVFIVGLFVPADTSADDNMYESSSDSKACSHEWESEYTLDREATCTHCGSRSIHCKKCSEKKDRALIPSKGHEFGQYILIKSADMVSDGLRVRRCANCKVELMENIPEISGISLSENEFTWDGTPKVPEVTVSDSMGHKLIQGTDYDVEYDQGRIDAGKYHVTVVFKGNYEGTMVASYEII